MNRPLQTLSATLVASLCAASLQLAHAQDDQATPRRPFSESKKKSVYPDMPAGASPVVPNAAAEAATEADMSAYSEQLVGSAGAFELVPIAGGSFQMGSADEAPAHTVQVAPFWIGKHEVRWDEYQLFMSKLDIEQRAADADSEPQDAYADAVSRPTPPYVPMDFGMGVEGYPAVCMTQFAAKQYTKWLSMKTGRFYRLPTEAEWEYACRAGSTTAYSFGDDDDDIDDYAWHFDNADDGYHKVGEKKPNAWGLYDMHGNVAEWVLDRHDEAFYATCKSAGDTTDPLAWPTELYPRVVRGGSWDDDPEDLRSAARRKSKKGWKVQDPQLPKSIWYHTDASFVGVRVVRPLTVPSAEERARYWEADLDSVRTIELKQRKGGR
jgi:formylglycine-generating enzyme required for sulfatase activity